MDFKYVGLEPQRDIVVREMTAWKSLSIEEKRHAESIYPLHEAVYNYFVSTKLAVSLKEDLQTVIRISKEIFHMLDTECEKFDNLVRHNSDLLREVITELKKIPGWLSKVRNDERIDKTCSAIIIGGNWDTRRCNGEKINPDVVGLDYEGLIDIILEVAPYIPRHQSLDPLRNLVSLGTDVLKYLEKVASSGSKNRKREEGDDGSRSGREEGDDGSRSGREEGDDGNRSGREEGDDGSRSGREEGDDGSRSGSSMRTLPHDFII